MFKKEYGPYGAQGPWTMGPMGPRDLGPKFLKIDKSCSYGPILNPWIGPK